MGDVEGMSDNAGVLEEFNKRGARAGFTRAKPRCVFDLRIEWSKAMAIKK